MSLLSRPYGAGNAGLLPQRVLAKFVFNGTSKNCVHGSTRLTTNAKTLRKSQESVRTEPSRSAGDEFLEVPLIFSPLRLTILRSTPR
jgi:hypothetical protein